MVECIFCKIVKGELPSHKIWEDDKHIAVLDLFPNMEGMALVIPKKHYDSYVFDMPSKEYIDFMLATEKVAKLLEKSLKVKRVALVMEGMGVNHAHMKLYPMHGIDEKFKEMWAKEKVYFDKYDGYITTQQGNKADDVKLAKLAEKIRKNL